MAKKHSHDDHFLPSPFSVVTSYENLFIKKFNDNLSGAVAEVLRYIARATASAIKENETQKAENNDIEKAHQVGDTHPNGRWVWTEYAPGKFDWRTAKKKDSGKIKPIELWKPVPAIQKAKTVDECLKVLYDANMINLRYSTLSGTNLETAKRVCTVIYNAHNEFKMDKIGIKTQRTLGNGTTAQAIAGRLVELNLRYFSNFDSARYYRDSTTRYHQNLQSNLIRLEVLEKRLKASGNYDPIRGKQLTQKIKLAKEKLERYPCYTTGAPDTACEDVVIHELGHILNSQCSGACGVLEPWKRGRKRDKKYLERCEKLNQEHRKLFQRYKGEKTLISEYSETKRAECFAECFVAYVHGDPKLPKYMRDYFDKYFRTTTPKNLL